MHTNFRALIYYPNIVKADKQVTHKHHIANVYNDPDHSEPFDITLPVSTDKYVQFCFLKQPLINEVLQHKDILFSQSTISISSSYTTLEPPNYRIIHILISFNEEKRGFQMLQLSGFPLLYVANHQVF